MAIQAGSDITGTRYKVYVDLRQSLCFMLLTWLHHRNRCWRGAQFCKLEVAGSYPSELDGYSLMGSNRLFSYGVQWRSVHFAVLFQSSSLICQSFIMLHYTLMQWCMCACVLYTDTWTKTNLYSMISTIQKYFIHLFNFLLVKRSFLTLSKIILTKSAKHCWIFDKLISNVRNILKRFSEHYFNKIQNGKLFLSENCIFFSALW